MKLTVSVKFQMGSQIFQFSFLHCDHEVVLVNSFNKKQRIFFPLVWNIILLLYTWIWLWISSIYHIGKNQRSFSYQIYPNVIKIWSFVKNINDKFMVTILPTIAIGIKFKILNINLFSYRIGKSFYTLHSITN